MELLLKFETNNEAETAALGAKIGAILKPGDIVTLEGDLGAGKTHFTGGAAKALGIQDYITSPTFTIVNEYTAASTAGDNAKCLTLYHFDLYRISSYDELQEIGFDEYAAAEAILFIEWADRVPEIMNIYKNRILQVKIYRRDDISPERRDIEIRRFG